MAAAIRKDLHQCFVNDESYFQTSHLVTAERAGSQTCWLPVAVEVLPSVLECFQIKTRTKGPVIPLQRCQTMRMKSGDWSYWWLQNQTMTYLRWAEGDLTERYEESVSGYMQKLYSFSSLMAYDAELADAVFILRAPGPLCERNMFQVRARRYFDGCRGRKSLPRIDS